MNVLEKIALQSALLCIRIHFLLLVFIEAVHLTLLVKQKIFEFDSKKQIPLFEQNLIGKIALQFLITL